MASMPIATFDFQVGDGILEVLCYKEEPKRNLYLSELQNGSSHDCTLIVLYNRKWVDTLEYNDFDCTSLPIAALRNWVQHHVVERV